MSAWPIPEEVVEAFATVGCRCAPGGCAAHGCEECRAAAIDFFERHRLVQLPDVDGSTIRWRLRGILIDLVEGDYERRSATAEFYANAIMDSSMVRVIPGQPITVDKEERDGDE